MFSFAHGLKDEIVINGEKLHMCLTYDTVLRFFELLNDEFFDESSRVVLGIQIFFGEDNGIPIEQYGDVLEQVIREYLVVERPSVVLASLENSTVIEKSKEHYSLTEDADVIFASFYFDYGIDLLERRGKLHWLKFKALLNNLSDESKLAQVIRIRQWKPSKHTSVEEKTEMRKLQKYYALGVSQKDAEELLYFNSLSGTEKEAFARNRLAELEE